MPKQLTAEEQLEKLNILFQKAKQKEKSTDVIDRIGSFTVYAAMTDFMVIQTARLMEQIILKGQLCEGKEPSFKPHEDSWFYERRFNSRKLIKDTKKLLPFQHIDSKDESTAKRVSDLANAFLIKAEEFLNHRNILIHHICSPKQRLEDIDLEVENANKLYYETLNTHKEFSEGAQPYRFGEKEIKYFYS